MESTIPGFTLIGIRLPGKTKNEGGQSGIDCGNLWQKFTAGKVAEKIPNKSSEEIYAVYFDYDGDHTKPFSYFIGCKTRPEAHVPEGLTRLVIPRQKYTKFVAKGKMPECIGNAWRQIWNADTDRAYQFDFEAYDERSRDWNNAEVDIFISTK